MIVIPAIDLKEGRCVRLIEGRLGTERVVSPDAVAQARAFEAAGAERLHVVDLDGAFGGVPKNAMLIASIVRAVSIPVEVGGGLRDEESVQAVLDLGATFAIVGTIAVTAPERMAWICAAHPGQVIAGIDAKKGMVATDGWVSESTMTTMEVAERAADMGVAAVIATDILRDGKATGVNVEDTGDLARTLPIPVIASGGVAGLDDIRALAATQIYGVIVGRALYDGSLDLREAIEVARGH